MRLNTKDIDRKYQQALDKTSQLENMTKSTLAQNGSIVKSLKSGSYVDSKEQELDDNRHKVLAAVGMERKLTPQEVDELRGIALRNIKRKIESGGELDDGDQSFIAEMKDRNEQKKAVGDIQNDFGLRFKGGFLDPKYEEQILTNALMKKFPNNPNIHVRQDNGTTIFTLNGKDFHPLDPTNTMKDLSGEVAEQTGRWIEPIGTVATGVGAGPLAGGAYGAGVQAIREGIEASDGLNNQNLGQRASDVALKGGTDALFGSVLDKLKPGKAFERFFTNTNQMRKHAGDIKTEGLTRQLEQKIAGADKDNIVSTIQNRLQQRKGQFDAATDKLYAKGDEMALKEMSGKGVDISQSLSALDKELQTAPGIKPENKDLIQKYIKTLSEQRAKLPESSSRDFAGIINKTGFDPTQATAYDFSTGKKFINDAFNAFPQGTAERAYVQQLRDIATGGTKELASAGSPAARYLFTADKLYKMKHDVIPTKLDEGLLGKMGDYGRVEKPSSGQVFDLLTDQAEGGLNSDDIKIMNKAIRSTPELQKGFSKDVYGTIISGKSASKPGLAEIRQGVRLQELPTNIPGNDVPIFEDLGDMASIKRYQDAGGSLGKAQKNLSNIVNPEKTSDLPQTVFNARGSSNYLKNNTKIDNLLGGQGDDILQNLQNLKFAQDQAQGKFIQQGAEGGLGDVGLNTLKTAASKATGGLSNIAANTPLLGAAGRTIGHLGAKIPNVSPQVAGAMSAIPSLSQAIFSGDQPNIDPTQAEELQRRLNSLLGNTSGSKLTFTNK